MKNNEPEIVESTQDDTVETILRKIEIYESIDSKVGVYKLFRQTHTHILDEINEHIKLTNPFLWEKLNDKMGGQIKPDVHLWKRAYGRPGWVVKEELNKKKSFIDRLKKFFFK